MKKSILVLSLLISVLTYSQEVFYTNKVISSYDGSKEFNVRETYPIRYELTDTNIIESVNSQEGISFYEKNGLDFETDKKLVKTSDVINKGIRVREYVIEIPEDEDATGKLTITNKEDGEYVVSIYVKNTKSGRCGEFTAFYDKKTEEKNERE
jgi:hypothetical protein